MRTERIRIPYNDAGQYAFEVMRGIAERIWGTAQDLTADFVTAEMPGAKTVSEKYESGKYLRTVQAPDGEQKVIAYDYRTKAVDFHKTRARKA
jgi:hypothetical protein